MAKKEVKKVFKKSEWASFRKNEDGSYTGLVPATQKKVK